MATNDEPICQPLEYDGHEPIPTTINVPLSAPGTGEGPKLKTRKTRRGWGAKSKKATKFTIFGNNANGLKAKKESLLNAIQKLGGPSCVLIQETKLRFPGTFPMPGYQIFEKIRKGLGGGLLTAVDENLSPMLISEGF